MINYRIKRIDGTAPNAWHVINNETNVTHSMWGSMELATQVMRDLNRARKAA